MAETTASHVCGHPCEHMRAHIHTHAQGKTTAWWPRTLGTVLHRPPRAPGLPYSPEAQSQPLPWPKHLCFPDTRSLPALQGPPLPAAGSPAAGMPGPCPRPRWGSGGLWPHLPRPYLRSHFIKLRPPLKQRPSPGPGPHPSHGCGLGRLGLTAPCLHDTLQLHIGA